MCLNLEYGESIDMPQYLSRAGVTMSISTALCRGSGFLKQRIWAKTFATNPDLHIRVGQGRGDYFILPLLDYPLACI